MSTIARLVVNAGGQGAWLLPGGVYRIGRNANCELHFDDGQISRFHATLIVADGAAKLVDHHSRNGTFVNGRTIDEAELEHGSLVQFGQVCCLYERLGHEDADESTHSGGPNPNVLESKLSSAEARIFVLLLEGLSEKEIAVRIPLSVHTVHNHVKRIYSAYGVHSRAELLAKALTQRPGTRSSEI